MEKVVSNFTKPIFFLLCTIVLIVMVYLEASRYFMNENTSSISFIKFNTSPRDVYPSFTLCFKGNKGDTIFNLSKNDALNYWKTITGKTYENKEQIKSLAGFSSATIDLRNMVKEFYTIDENNKKINRWIREKEHAIPSKSNPLNSPSNSSIWPFYISFQNPDKICFSKHVTFQQSGIKKKDAITLNSKTLSNLTGNGQLFLYVHYPQHTIRSFGEEVAFLLLTKKSGDINKMLRIKISGVNVIRKRLDAKVPCNPKADDQDTYFRNAIVSNVSCIPPYLKSFFTNDTNMGPYLTCESSKKLKQAYYDSRAASVRNAILGKDASPCTEMSVSSSIEMKTNRTDLSLVFHYRSKEYMETVNKRAYEVGDLLSSVGGFIGMFLGYGLFQVPEVLSALPCSLTRIIKRSRDGYQ